MAFILRRVNVDVCTLTIGCRTHMGFCFSFASLASNRCSRSRRIRSLCSRCSAACSLLPAKSDVVATGSSWNPYSISPSPRCASAGIFEDEIVMVFKGNSIVLGERRASQAHHRQAFIHPKTHTHIHTHGCKNATPPPRTVVCN